ncbi:MAG: magnesium transporter, partial [Deltaproteobacteria bacterium]|nr:magnesium transporter [Deltaproteobacteria bacterium]
MTPHVTPVSPRERETILETLLIQAEFGQDASVRTGIATLHPADVAELLDAVEEPELKQKIFGFLSPDIASEVLSLVSPLTQSELTEELSNAALGDLVERLDSDDAADLLAALPEEQARAVLEQVPEELSAEMAQLLRYPPDTAGGIMQTEHVEVPSGARADEAIEIIRRHIDEVPDIHNVFVVDDQRHLIGVLPLRKLILARPDDRVEQIMDRRVISARVDLDQEQVAQLFQRYDLVSLPVVDPQGVLLGRITIDDAVDVLEEEATEDIYKLGGLGGEDGVFDSPWRSIRRRLPWLALNLLTTTLGATVIALFEGTIQTVAIAAAFMTMVAAQGGNAGIQTLTVIVRGLALGEVGLGHIKRVLVKELFVALGNGLALASAAGVVAYMWKGELLIGVVLSLALVANLTIAAFIGTMIPFTMRWIGIDPAVASSVLVTACTD